MVTDVASVRWSQDEDYVLGAHYTEYGPSWEGWESLLPGRTKSAIKTRARTLGLTVPKRANTELSIEEIDILLAGIPEPSPSEDDVMKLLALGFTPSQIDRQKNWDEGKAKRLIINRWQRTFYDED